MLSKKQKQFIQKLQNKKYRNSYNCFIVEGKKAITEFIKAKFKIHSIYSTQNIWTGVPEEKIIIISKQELENISYLQNPDEGIAIFEKTNNYTKKEEQITIALDNIRDPGNLGTIIRLADWFDIKNIICSEGCVDCYNPKVVQASMGSLARVNIVYTNLKSYLKSTNIETFACTLNGENIYDIHSEGKSIIVLGNEANGINSEIISLCKRKITIPQFGGNTAESLNVAIAGAIVISNFIKK